MIVGIIYGLLIARTWILMPVINIVSSVLVQVLLIMTLDLSTAEGVLVYSLWNAVWGLVMYLAYFFFRIVVLRKAEKTGAPT
jgi:hypothetical protein